MFKNDTTVDTVVRKHVINEFFLYFQVSSPFTNNGFRKQ